MVSFEAKENMMKSLVKSGVNDKKCTGIFEE
jgi:hypothetical protein